MAFSKNDLYYKDYIWTAKYSNDDPKITGEPDKTLFARKEGGKMELVCACLGSQLSKNRMGY